MNLLRIFFVATALSTAAASQAQYTFGLQTGLLQSLMKDSPPGAGDNYEKFENGGGYTIGLTAIRQCSRHISLGGSARYIKRNFSYYYVSQQNSYFFEDHYNAGFLYLGAIADLGLGKKQIFHIAVTPSFGCLTDGTERYYTGAPLSSFGGNTNDSKLTNSNGHMSKTDFRLGGQLYLSIPIRKGLCISPGIAYNMGFSSLNNIRNMHPADLIFSLGVSYTTKKQNRKTPVNEAPAAIPVAK